ncbi:MAG: ABC transporter substrate-binding protein [Chloroflexi bacterium]|nr:ABC transporter substrate-binding protein [Chloroflexota bacterium]MYE38939.1 ABC transporter substrate-binding protein [Chloroflexota bacterium]
MSLNKQPEVISLDPQLLGDIIENVRMLGRATGAEERADEIAEDMEARIEAVTARAADADTKPSVLHVEWADPLMCGGHWVPEMVDLAGGSNTFGDKDTGTFKLEWEEVVERQPDIIVMMPCGFDVKRGLEDVPILAEREGWKDLPAVRNDRVYVVDASAYTSRSGPRLVTGLEIMAEMIHPELFSGKIPEQGALRLFNA